MQPNAPVVHAQKGHCQHQRNRNGHHQTRAHIHVIAAVPHQLAFTLVQPQRNKTHAQYNRNGLDQGAQKFVDRAGNGSGLILNFRQTHAHRQSRFNGLGSLLQRLAQRDDVAPLGHGNTQGDDGLALVAHLGLRRVDESTRDRCNVAQAQLAIGCATDG